MRKRIFFLLSLCGLVSLGIDYVCQSETASKIEGILWLMFLIAAVEGGIVLWKSEMTKDEKIWYSAVGLMTLLISLPVFAYLNLSRGGGMRPNKSVEPTR